MATSKYALQLTLVSPAGTPLIRCWGPCINLSSTTTGWHHYIVSFDSNAIPRPRVQMALDRGGGEVHGGGVMDTNLGTGVISSAGAFPTLPSSPAGGSAPQQMFATLEANSQAGFAPTGAALADSVGELRSRWAISAENGQQTDFAYAYFGVSKTHTFFDLTNSSNLNSFITTGLAAVNLGASGSSVAALSCRIMHTGGARPIYGIGNRFDNPPPDVPIDDLNLADLPPVWDEHTLYHTNDYVRTQEEYISIGGQVITSVRWWVAAPVAVLKSLGPNIDKSPLEWGRSLRGTGYPVPYWEEVEPPVQRAEFRWNAANGLISDYVGDTMTDAPTRPPTSS